MGRSNFSVEIVLSHSTKNIRRGTFPFLRNILISTFLGIIGESRFCRNCFWSHDTETFRGGNPLVFHYFRVSKKFRHNGERSRLFVANFLSHSIKNIRRGTLLCSRNFLVSDFFWILGVSRLCRVFFVLRYWNISWGNPLVFQWFRVSKTFKHRMGITRFSVENFFLTYQKFS